MRRGAGRLWSWGEGDKRLPGSKVIPTQNFQDLVYYFFGREPSSRAKTNKNKNERHWPRLHVQLQNPFRAKYFEKQKVRKFWLM